MSTKRVSLILVSVLLLVIIVWRVAPGRAEIIIPEDYTLLNAAYGLEVYARGSSPVLEVVQVVDLDSGADVILRHGDIVSPGTGDGDYGGDNPYFERQSLDTAWQELITDSLDPLCITNGQFFSPAESYSTPLAFPLKINGEVISDGYGIDEFPQQKLMLELWPEQARITPLSGEALYNSTAPDILAGLATDAPKSPNASVGRTFVGIADNDGDGAKEHLLIYNAAGATQLEAAQALREWGAEDLIMLDGGGSTQLICNGDTLIESSDEPDRTIPQTVATVPGRAKTVALLIDSSGSMAWNDPTGMRQEAARAFIDFAHIGDKIAIVDFDGDAAVLAPLHRIESDDDRVMLQASVSAIDNFGTTDLNQALNEGFAQLSSDGGDNIKAAILLTDGRQDVLNVPPYDDNSHQQYVEAGWSVYTVALGDDIDADLLSTIADSTGGKSIHLDNPSQMQTVYAELSTDIGGDRTLVEEGVMLSTGQVLDLNANIPALQTEVSFYIGWPGSTASLWLTDPTSRQITPGVDAPDVRHAKGLTYELYVISNPRAGQWKLHLYGDDLPPGGEIVDVRVFVDGEEHSFLPFTTKSSADTGTSEPPPLPSSPSPADGTVVSATNLVLSWQTNGDASIMYDVVLEALDTSPDIYRCQQLREPSCTPGTLMPGVTYYWRVVAHGESGQVTYGSVWRFTTQLNAD